MEKLWNKEVEQRFFNEAQKFATPEQLFYVSDAGKYLAYWPKKLRWQEKHPTEQKCTYWKFHRKMDN